MDDLLNDKRFAHVASDPKFKRIPRAERMVKIDKRFQSMFKDKKFKVQYTIDKRGRPIQHTSSENLRKYYELSSSEEEEEDDDNDDDADDADDDDDDDEKQEQEKIKQQKKKKSKKYKKKEKSKKLPDKVKEKLKDLNINYARGEGVLMSDSSSEEDSDTSDEEEIEHNWGELDKDAVTTDEITHRLAICNMDWDRIRAVDLMVLFNSFLPSGGLIHSVTIYPSEFGLERMKEEEINGPKELVEMSKEDIQDDSDAEEGSTYHVERLRQYQLNRLKYYYAVIEFDSAKTANKIYTECDGTEYESTAAKLDLRFIPDDMKFDQTPKEVCNKLPEPSKYEPRIFTTTALQQVKVDLTWDETNPERMEITQKLNSGKLDEIDEKDLQNYLATDSSADEAEEEKEEQKESQEDESDSEEEKNDNPIEKYKALLKEIEEKEETNRKKDVELEFTWGLGTQEKAEKLVQERLKKDENLTPFEQYLEKRKAKKKAKREERKKRENTDKDALDSDNSEMVDSDDDDVKTKNNKSSHRKKSMKQGLASSDDEDEERRKAELELLLMDENEDGKQHFNMKKIEENATMTKSKQKRLNKKKNAQDQIVQDNFEVNVQDSRFNALFTSHHFNIDPADPHYRKTKGTEALIKEKLKRRVEDEPSEVSITPIYEIPAKQSKVKSSTELQALIKTVKKNTRNMSKPIK
ncbi:ESF1 like protein [Habropoda laboriosa]|uniref:ESF1 like protein n=1 Tax=Habropoda laboriosa TaxID=597456 RepID=A0A0L7RHW2_9HYME|nr:ESF1 like protein [Habropoda laboriosa]